MKTTNHKAAQLNRTRHLRGLNPNETKTERARERDKRRRKKWMKCLFSFLNLGENKLTVSAKKNPEERRADWIFTAWKLKLKQTNKKRQKIIRGIDRCATLYSHGGDAKMEKRLHWSHAWTFYTERHGYTKVNSDQYIWIRNAISSFLSLQPFIANL